MYLAAIIGMAECNEMVENANFTAEHILRTCKLASIRFRLSSGNL